MMSQDNILQAADILRKGGLVAIPTETVYGLGADASNPDALRKIFLAKQRPIDHPLIVHIGEISKLSDWAVNISDSAWLLAKTFWPGPLTLILEKKPGVSDLVTGHQNTVGIRMPNHPVALALLRVFGGGVAAPSANRFGRISPTSAQAVEEELGQQVDLILDGGSCEVGVESTIVDMTGSEPVILRPGMITANQLEEVLQRPVCSEKREEGPRVSGSLESHYAPQTKTMLMSKQCLDHGIKKLSVEDLPVGVLARYPQEMLVPGIIWVKMPEHPEGYAHDLYHVLRELDKKGLGCIFIEEVPAEEEWKAIDDRLKRAASKKE